MVQHLVDTHLLWRGIQSEDNSLETDNLQPDNLELDNLEPIVGHSLDNQAVRVVESRLADNLVVDLRKHMI